MLEAIIWPQINLENIIITFYLTTTVLMLTTFVSKTMKSFSEYGKQTAELEFGFFYIYKNKNWAHMYIVALFMLVGFLYLFYGRIEGEDSYILELLSYQAHPIETEAQLTCSYQLIIILFLLIIQVIRRGCEELFLAKNSSAKLHIIGYVFGIAYYIAEILGIIAGTLFCTTIQGLQHNIQTQFYERLMETALMPNVLIGIFIFISMSLYQDWHHKILAEIRNNKPKNIEKEAGEIKKYYAIPYGHLFKYVGSPHYFCEILIYISFLIITGGSYILLWVIFEIVVFNLSLTADRTHKWYKLKFNNYPNRKRLFPFIW